MSKLPKINRRAWLATWLQDRRRARQAKVTVPNAPVINFSSVDWDASTPGYADVTIGWAFDHGSFPVSIIEVQVSQDGVNFNYLGESPSNVGGYTYASATNAEADYYFKVRYWHDTFGPFSNIYPVLVRF